MSAPARAQLPRTRGGRQHLLGDLPRPRSHLSEVAPVTARNLALEHANCPGAHLPAERGVTHDLQPAQRGGQRPGDGGVQTTGLRDAGVAVRSPADRAAAEHPCRPAPELTTHPPDEPAPVPEPLVVVDGAAHHDGVVLHDTPDDARGEDQHLAAAGVKRPTEGSRAAAALVSATLLTIRQPSSDFSHHRPSHMYEASAYPELTTFWSTARLAVSLHGHNGTEESVYVGGRNRDQARRLHRVLERRLPGWAVASDLDAIPTGLRGLHPRNPVNLCELGGVQLELPTRLLGWRPDRAGGLEFRAELVDPELPHALAEYSDAVTPSLTAASAHSRSGR